MATPNHIDARGATQMSKGDEDAASISSITNLDIPTLIVPDLNNTPLEEAIKDGMKVGPAEFLIARSFSCSRMVYYSGMAEPNLRPGQTS